MSQAGKVWQNWSNWRTCHWVSRVWPWLVASTLPWKAWLGGQNMGGFMSATWEISYKNWEIADRTGETNWKDSSIQLHRFVTGDISTIIHLTNYCQLFTYFCRASKIGHAKPQFEPLQGYNLIPTGCCFTYVFHQFCPRCGTLNPVDDNMYVQYNTGWWFQTFFIFHNIWDHPWLIFFKMVKTTTRYVCVSGWREIDPGDSAEESSQLDFWRWI